MGAAMIDLPVRRGVCEKWQKRKLYVDFQKRMTPSDSWIQGHYNFVHSYINGEINSAGCSGLLSLSVIFSSRSIVELLSNDDAWANDVARNVAYTSTANRILYFSCVKYWGYSPPESRGMMSMSNFSWRLSQALWSGLVEDGIYLGYMANAMLNRGYQLVIQYRDWHDRGSALMLRIFADWQGFEGHRFPPYAYDTPLYEGVLEHWRDADPAAVEPWLLALADQYTWESKPPSKSDGPNPDFASEAHFPLAILLILRLRQLMGLENPVLDHPLMAPPWDVLPEPIAPYPDDDLITGCLKRARSDWPEFDSVTSLDALRKDATAAQDGK